MRPTRWFAERFEHEGKGSRRYYEPFVFAWLVAAPSLCLGILVDAAVMKGSMIAAFERAGMMLLVSPLLVVGGVLVTALTAHVILRAIGAGKGGFWRTASSVGFAAGAEVWSVVPWLGPLTAGVWRSVVLIKGLQVAHGLPRYRALIAVVAGPLWLVVISLAFRLSLFDNTKVPASSMIPTILPGDHLLVGRLPYQPARGDVIVFHYPENPSELYVKRIVGLGGDEVTVVGGRTVINGWTVPRCRVGSFEPPWADGPLPSQGDIFVEFLGSHAYLVFIDRAIAAKVEGDACRTNRDCPDELLCQESRCVVVQGPFPVRSGEAWVLGDNRYNSSDSRAWFDGRGGGVPESYVLGPAWMVWAHVEPDGSLTLDRTGVLLGGPPQLGDRASEALVDQLAWCLARRPPIAQTTPPGRSED